MPLLDMATDTSPASSPSLALRRNAPVPFIKTSFDDSLLQVSTPRFPDHASKSPTKADARPLIAASPRPPPPLREKKSNKSSLFNLFSKPNVERARGSVEPGLVQAPASRSSSRSRSRPPKERRPVTSGTDKKSDHTPNKLKRLSAYGPPPHLPTQPNLSWMDALRDLEPPPPPPTQHTPSHAQLAASWKPPPLFQAYPQAVTHARLQDADICISTAKIRALGSRDGSNPSSSSRPGSEESVQVEPSAVEDETRKIFVLVTSGYLLQYAGTGPSDRQPQRVMKLGPSSVAYASDAIPGKHWVLQVMQSANEDDSCFQAPKKGLFSRMLGSSSRRRSKPVWLLVFDSPLDMKRWMEIIRKEVERLNGHRSRPATAVAPGPLSQHREPLPVAHRALTIARAQSPSQLSPTTQASPRAFHFPRSPTIAEPDSTSRSSAVTAVGTFSNQSSTRSSTQPPGSTVNDLKKMLSTPVIEHFLIDNIQEEPNAESNMRDDESHELMPSSASPERKRGTAYIPSDGLKSHPVPPSPRFDTDMSPASAEQPFFSAVSTPVVPPSFSENFQQQKNDLRPNVLREERPGPTLRYALYPSKPQKLLAQTPMPSPNPLQINSDNTRPPLRQTHSTPQPPTSLLAHSPPTSLRTASGAHESSFRQWRSDSTDRPPQSPIGNAFAQQADEAQRWSPTSRSAVPLDRSNAPHLAQPSRRDSLGQAYRSDSGNSSRRTSIIRSNAPIPLRASRSECSLTSFPDANATRLGLGISVRPREGQAHGETEISLQKKSASQAGTPPAVAGRDAYFTPAPSAPPPLPPTDRPLRRPSSIIVNTEDVPAFLSSARSSMQMPTSATSSIQSPASAGPSPPETRGLRTRERGSSTTVPVIRPPVIKPGRRMSRQQRLSLQPPSQPPPTLPLPRLPEQVPEQVAV